VQTGGGPPAARRPFADKQTRLVVNTNSWYQVRMAKNTSFVLGDHFQSYVDEKVRGGAYASASEVIREALRLMQERDERLSALRAALIKGEQSGRPRPLDRAKFFERMRRGRQ
jgi:antitoxin ParD1/3/4